MEDAIRTRRTIKRFDTEPIPQADLHELIDLARWAPNHHLTNPWGFYLVGPGTLDRLKAVSERRKSGSAAKLDRAPTLVAVTTRVSSDPVVAEEDLLASGVAAYIVLLTAHARGYAGYWRSAGVLTTEEGRAALELPTDERCIGILYLGRPRANRPPPHRASRPPRVVVTQ